MTEVTAKTSALILTAPRILTNEQRTQIAEAMGANLPSDVGVIVLDPGFTVLPVSGTPVTIGELVTGELAQDETQAQILTELKGLRADLAAQHERMNALGLRVFTE